MWMIALAASAQTRSWKRGVAYAMTQDADFEALAPKVSWWYNWHHTASTAAMYKNMEFVPMCWNFNCDKSTIEASIAKHSSNYLLVLNEPNLLDQANMDPVTAATNWPQYEAIAASTGVKLVGPAMTYGTTSGYHSPITWLDEFFAACNSKYGRDCQVDMLAVHWYDYGLDGLLNSLMKYKRKFWVTEMANWHKAADFTIDSAAKQKARHAAMPPGSTPDVFARLHFSLHCHPLSLRAA